MNIRFSERHIRIRVTRSELDRLIVGNSLALQLPLPGEQQFRIAIEATPRADWQCEGNFSNLFLFLPRAALTELSQTLPRREGLTHEFQTEGGPVEVDFEIDLRPDRKS